MKSISTWASILAAGFLCACNLISLLAPAGVPSEEPAAAPSPTARQASTSEPLALSIRLGSQSTTLGITLDAGGDVDTTAVSLEDGEARQTGNGAVLVSADGNSVPDSFIQFNVDDQRLYAGSPTSRVRIEVDYLDQGMDTFLLEYDALPTAASDGLFASGGEVIKTGSGGIKTASFNLYDANFANRDNGADIRIGDNIDGAEIILEVRVAGLGAAETSTVRVDDFGANPFDEAPDSDAIQQALDSSSSGDTIVFTSGVNSSGYQGYRVDKTIFLTGMSAKHDLVFTSSDPQNHALLKATGDLKGYVVRMYARSRFDARQNINNIDFGYIDVDGGRDARVCMGTDQVGDGVGDNWGSWLPECDRPDDPWCSPGNLAFDGGYGGIAVHDLVSRQGECGSALAFFVGGGGNHLIDHVTIDTAGDHVHASGCANTDNDGDYGGWSDGMTVEGRNVTITNNTVINPSDIGIVTFGGRETIIANNTIQVTAGNYGAFGAIALHPWAIADASGVQVSGNVITSEGDSTCGGLHVGINIGPHMWGGACVESPMAGTYGNPSCSSDPDPNQAAACMGDKCQVWLLLREGKTFAMQNNTVTGTHINYLVEGFIIKGQFVDENNTSLLPRRSDWDAARVGCDGVTWGPLDKVAHHPSLPGYTDLRIHCER